MRDYEEDFSSEEKPKRKHSDDPTTWGQAWQALGILLCIMLLSAMLSNFLQSLLLGDKVNRYTEIIASSRDNINPFSNLSALYDSPISLVIGIVLWLLICLLGLFLMYGLIHFFAARLGGIGTMRGLIVQSNLWMMMSYGLLSVTAIFGNSFLINNVVDFAAQNNISPNSLEFIEFLSSQIQVIAILYLSVWLIWGIGMSCVAAQHYQFGRGKGCLTLVLLHLAVFGIYLALGIAILSFL